MTTVQSGESIRRRYEWIVPVPYERGAVVGEVQDAMAMAATVYKTVTGGSTSYDDWLRVSVTDESVVFWFEVDEEPGKAIPREVRAVLQNALLAVTELLKHANAEDTWGVRVELERVLRGDFGGLS
ncbi:hypothetical protein [Nocardia wallacei]|uniref:hypothetical protein n=1 Tax=Nocardia wallacei TaxID=480035 RepID=UPI002453DCB1|nr:hypothetical protein [Nocardia wallacei]